MNTRRGFRRYGEGGDELRVKEVVVPVQRDELGAGPSQNSKLNDPNSFPKLGKQGNPAFCGLVALKKPLLDDYVQGNKKKIYRKRKPKCNKNNTNNDAIFSDLFLQTNERIESKDKSARDLSSTVETLEQKLLKVRIERKMQNYNEWIKEQEKVNFRRQRLLEKQSMEQQKKLAETWLGFIERRREMRDVFFASHPLYHHHHWPINDSLTSKKYWNGDADKIQKKPEERKEEREIKSPLTFSLNDLEDEFREKLVFIDTSDEIPRSTGWELHGVPEFEFLSVEHSDAVKGYAEKQASPEPWQA